MIKARNLVVKGRSLLSPLVNQESTLLLFATFISHHQYFGADHTIADFLALDGAGVVVYSYAAFVLMASLIQAPADWKGFVDTLFMRLADIIIMAPYIIILTVLAVLFDVELIHLAILIGIISGFGGTAVIIKSQALSVKVRTFVEAARVAGGSDAHIIFRHIVPNLLPLSFLYMMFTVTTAIFSEAVLSYFGLLKIRMSWGLMIHTTEYAGYFLQIDKWWLVFPASLSITLLCAAFYLVGRALDEVVNPRLRRR